MLIYALVLSAVVSTSSGISPCTLKNKGKIAHPDECQLYYDCSKPESDLPRQTEPYLQECNYPDLFDVAYRSCRNFEVVDCGHRKVIKDVCDTLKYRMAGAHGRPCHVDNLDCEGLTDGKHAFPYMPNSPYYAVCYKERFLAKATCPKDDLGRFMLFDETTGSCSPQDDN